MSNDYTLPPMPSLRLYQRGYERFDMEDYGHACAAPLLARIAELDDDIAALRAGSNLVAGVLTETREERDRLRAEVEALRAEVQQLKNDEACIHFAGAEDARAGVHELFTGLADCEIEVPDEWHEKPLLRFMFEVDPGDDTVGMGSSAAWSLAKDQSGTVLLDLLSTIRDADAQRTLLDSARYKMQAFRDWLINEITETQTGTYDVKRIYAEDIVDQFEEGLDAAIAARKGEGSEG